MSPATPFTPQWMWAAVILLFLPKFAALIFQFTTSAPFALRTFRVASPVAFELATGGVSLPGLRMATKFFAPPGGAANATAAVATAATPTRVRSARVLRFMGGPF